MSREEEEAPPVRIGSGYPFAQMARAFVTALTHEDEPTRERAEGRVAQWRAVLNGIASGKLRIGSRTPVKDLPAWVTPEVVRGGFATGKAAASGPLEPWEREVARAAGVDATREALFAHHLTERGLAELNAMLDGGGYAVRVPEEAALLVVAWLVAAGETEAALALTGELAPFAGRLRFAPQPVEPATADHSVVYRDTAGEARVRLEARRPNERVEAMREALTVWNPFADEVLSLWLEARGGEPFPPGWREHAAALLERYRELARVHTRARKHRRPKENLAILLRALETVVAGRDLDARQAGLLRHAIDSMVARRGAPGSDEHRALRERQARNAAEPAHHAIARVVATRLATLPPLRGVEDVEALLAPVAADEATADVPAGTPVPRSIHRVVRRTMAGTPEELIEQGVIPSAEVLAALVPRIAGTTVAAAYGDERLRSLMAAHYEAFRNRRSLLLLNLEHQVRIDELPWVRAVAGHRTAGGEGAAEARAALTRLAELTIDAFPATITPSPLVTELDALAREAGIELPLLEELAADIFMGTFSAKFLAAAKLAGRLLQGSLYERYYGIDYAGVLAIDDVRKGRFGGHTSAAFDALCGARAGSAASGGGFSVAANGMVIEQAQILTTQNLAALTGRLDLSVDWAAAARRGFERAIVLAVRLRGNRMPLRTVKDLAYAWRQIVFFLSRMPPAEVEAFVAWADDSVAAKPDPAGAVLGPVLGGMRDVLDGEGFDAEGRSRRGRRLLGWTAGRHWVLDVAREAPPR